MYKDSYEDKNKVTQDEEVLKAKFTKQDKSKFEIRLSKSWL